MDYEKSKFLHSWKRFKKSKIAESIGITPYGLSQKKKTQGKNRV